MASSRTQTPVLSLIIAVYNKPENLRLILTACSVQTLKNFEVIVADDGSGAEIADVIAEAQQKCIFPVHHLWHEDIGWRKNIMLNKAIRTTQSDYLVFIDGDCVPHRQFLEDHFSEREEKKVISGRRAEMSERWSKQLTIERIKSGVYEKIGSAEAWDGIIGNAICVEEGVRFENIFLRNLFHGKERGILGCNFSVFKKDIEAINGFDEMYNGPGCGEDSDIQFRLGLIGIECKTIRHKAIQFHLYHPNTVGSQFCIQRFDEVQRVGKFWCERGLVQQ